MTMVSVYVPAPGSISIIDSGSGIVGTALDGDRILVDYEGNRYGAANLATWADRVSHAHGRHQDRYPTVARAALPASELVQVGYFDTDAGQVLLDPEHVAAVAAWTGVDAAQLPQQCASTAGHYQRRRDLAALRANPQTRHAARLFARRHRLQD